MNPTSTAPAIVPLDAGHLTRDSAGGKAFRLGQIARAGFPVPRSEVVLRETLDHLALTDFSCWPASLTSSLHQLFRRLSQKTGAVAVRSSGVCEDGENNSYAGHFHSVLSVRSNASLVKAVHEVWSSYRAQAKTTHGASSGAVLVQEMLHPTVSGVYFTRSPLPDGREEALVEAVFGLGDAMVSGKLTPDFFRLRRSDGSLIQARLAPKLSQSQPSASGDGTDLVPRLLAKEREPTLDQRALHELHRVGGALEKLLEQPLDIEFAFQDRELFVLQARPITSLSTNKEELVWTAANSQEVLPNPVTPLSWSLFFPLIERGRADLFRKLGLRDPDTQTYLALFYGRPYFNRDYFKEFIEQTPGVPLEIFDALIFGDGQEIDFRRPPLSFLAIKILAIAASERLFAKEKLDRFIRAFDKRQRAFERSSLSSLPDHGLIEFSEAVTQLMESGFRKHVLGTALSGAHMVFLRAFLERVGFPNAEALTNRLVHASARVLPATSCERLYALAQLADAELSLKHAIEEQASAGSGASWEAFAERARALCGGSAFLEELERFRSDLGHRGIGEADLIQPRWGEDPDFFFRTLRMYCELPPDRAPDLRRKRLEDRLRVLRHEVINSSQLHSGLMKLAFRVLLHWANTFAAYRENLKHHALRSLALLRRVFLEAGRRLAQRDLLTIEEDVFFLTVPEVRRALLSEEGGADLGSTVTGRRTEHRANLALTPPKSLFRGHTTSGVSPLPRVSSFLTGAPLSPGRVIGRARVLISRADSRKMKAGEILVARAADPGWTPLFYLAGAIAVDVGGVLSHAAVIAREYGVPAVAALKTATETIHSGDLVEVDGDVGQVRILQRAGEA